MPVCCICEGDGVLEAVGQWYCNDHLEEGILDVVLFVARVRGWHLESTEEVISAWLEQ